jgi:hypothetical protein
MSFDPEQVRFGNGRVVGTVLADPEYHTLDAEQQAIRMGRAVGCPVVQKVLRDRGNEGARDRYFRVGFWFGQAVHTAERVNESLANQLKAEVWRRPGEPVGIHEPESVPGYYGELIPPTETLTGFALPRLLIELHDSKALAAQSTSERYMTVWGMLEDAATQAQTPAELLARCAQGAVNHGMSAVEVLKATLPAGWYGEHNGDYMALEAKTALIQHAPDVWGEYNSRSDAAIAAMGVL